MRILSSRTFVTGRGAFPFCRSMKPQLIVTISRSPSADERTTGAMCFGNIADVGSNEPARLCETRKKRVTASRFLLSEYKLHIGGYWTAASCSSEWLRHVRRSHYL